MSVQEVNLKAIADAIREKEGSKGTIKAEDFADRIRKLDTGGVSSAAKVITGQFMVLAGSKGRIYVYIILPKEIPEEAQILGVSVFFKANKYIATEETICVAASYDGNEAKIIYDNTESGTGSFGRLLINDEPAVEIEVTDQTMGNFTDGILFYGNALSGMIVYQ